MSLNVPAYSVQVSFTDPFDTPDWVDITRWVKSGSTKRGRQHELQRAIAGTCALTVSNQDGRFSTFNQFSPYVNAMTAADSYFQDQAIGSPPGTWGNTGNCTLSLVANEGYDGYPAMSMTASSATTMTASTPLGTSGYPVTAGKTYGFQAQFKAASTGRACSLEADWYDSGGSYISANAGSTFNDHTTTYTKATLTAKAPTGAAYVALFVKVASPANAEVHYVTRCMISSADSYGQVSTAWAPGGRGLVPARPVQVFATWSSTQYPVYYGYVDSWLPSYGVSLSDQIINCTDGMNLLALAYLTRSDYEAQLIVDGAAGYWGFGDAVGSPTAADSTVNGVNLVVTSRNQPTFGEPGLLFSNTSTAMAVTHGVAVATSPPSGWYSAAAGLTVEFVVESTTFTDATIAQVLCELIGAQTYLVEASTGGFVQLNLPSAGNVTSATTLNDGYPHHVMFAISLTGYYVLYVDGVSVLSGSDTAPTGSPDYGIAFGAYGVAGVTFTLAGMAVTTHSLNATVAAAHAALSKTGFIQQQSGDRITAVLDTLGVPSSLQNIAIGISAVQAPQSALTTTPALSYIQTVENTEQGFFFCDESGNFTFLDRHYVLQNSAATTSNGTFANDTNNTHYKFLAGSIIPGDDALDWWTDTPVSAVTNASIGVTGAIQDTPNPDGVRAGGSRTLQGYSSMLQTTDTEAASLSQWLMAHYGMPVPRVRQMKLDSTTTNPSSLPQMLGRKLWDRITVIWQPIDGTGSPFDQDSLIESIEHSFGPDLWTTTWGLSVAETQAYFTLNSASLGTLAADGALAGNRLGY